jgi:hypothetical protein
MAKKQRNISLKERIWIAIAITFFVSGLTLSIISLIGDFLPVINSNNWVVNAENAVIEFLNIPLDWLGWGTILLILGAIILTITLNTFAQKEQVLREKEERRSQRLKEASES